MLSFTFFKKIINREMAELFRMKKGRNSFDGVYKYVEQFPSISKKTISYVTDKLVWMKKGQDNYEGVYKYVE